MFSGGAGSRVNHAKFRKLMSGKIVKQIEEQYLRNDVPCGYKDCSLCDVNFTCGLELNLTNQEMKEEKVVVEKGVFVDPTYMQQTINDKIFLIDHHFALE